MWYIDTPREIIHIHYRLSPWELAMQTPTQHLAYRAWLNADLSQRLRIAAREHATTLSWRNYVYIEEAHRWPVIPPGFLQMVQTRSPLLDPATMPVLDVKARATLIEATPVDGFTTRQASKIAVCQVAPRPVMSLDGRRGLASVRDLEKMVLVWWDPAFFPVMDKTIEVER